LQGRHLRGLYEVLEQIVLRWRDGCLPGLCHVEVDFSADRMAERIEAALVRAAREPAASARRTSGTVEA
jgi:hypothetical protein